MFGNIGNALRGAAGTMFGSDPSAPGWEDLQRRREIADMLRSQAMATPVNNWGDGVGNVMRALGHRFMDRKLDPLEDQERTKAGDSFQQVLAALGGGGSGGGYSGSPMPSGGPMGTPFVSGRNAPTGPATAPEGYGPPGGDFASLYPQVEQQYQLPGGYLERLATIESGGRPDAANPNSSARGLFQFIDSTAQQYGVDPMDPVSSTHGAGRLAADNAAQLRRVLGRDPTPGELYLAHQQGAGGATQLLSNPDAPAAALVGEEAVRLNGGDVTMSARDFANQWVGKFEGGAGGGGVYSAGGMGAAQPNMDAIAQISELLENPYLGEGQRAVAQSLLQQQVGLFGASDAMTSYQQAQIELQQQKLGLDRERMQVDSRGEYGLAPVWGTDASGNPAMIQLGRDGTPIQTPLPEGFNVANKPIEIDAGTETILLDPQTRQPIGSIPKDIAGAAGQKEVGEAAGQAAAGLGSAKVNVQSALDQIGRIVSDPALPGVVGNIQGRLPPMTQDGANVVAQIDGLASKAFINAIESLRGLGAMSEMEAKAATDSIANLSRIQDEGALTAELSRMGNMLSEKLAVATAKAATVTDTASSPAMEPAAAQPSGAPEAPAAPAAPAAPDWLTNSDVTKWTPEQMDEAERLWGLK